MRLAHPQLLWLLLLVPAAVLAYSIAFVLRRRALARLGNPSLIARMAAVTSVPRKVARATMVCLAIGLVALALARPQSSGRARLEKQRGLDLVVALDFSKSMLAKDIYPSRLERAKRELERLMDQLSGDRVGLVAFAGETLTYPPTTDYDAVKLFWRDLGPADLPVGGTAIGRALTAGIEMLSRLRAKGGETRDQVILLLTDGEETESQPLDAADEAAKLAIKVFAIGIGSRSGDLVPDLGESGQAAGYIKDKDGKYVTSRLGEDLLSKIAAKTGGGYLRADAQNFGVEAISAALAGLKRAESEARLVRQYDEVFAFLLVPALLLLLVEACLGERRRRGAQGMAALVLAALLPFLGAWSPLERNNRAAESGNASLRAGKAEEALAAYDKAVAEAPNDPAAHFNRGNALYALSRFEEASAEFLRATQSAAPGLRPSAFYNLGNSYFKNDKFEDAIAAYRHALALDPANERAKWNLELALQRKKEEDEKKKKEDEKQDEKDQDKQQDENQDKQDQDKKQDEKDQDKQDQDKKQDEKQQQNEQQREQQQQQQQQQQQEQQQQEQQQQDRAEEKTPDMREIDAVLDNLERSPKDLEKMRARLRAIRRAPPLKDW
ncbi:MAG: VWA domain-containing protein [Deltaproteobacteria bacterium]|nr:VWA domain-containing protein [Deltaproteobacteria bacterium]